MAVLRMKVFFYDPETGIFQGESFESEHADLRHGITTIAPPAYQKGEVPVFSWMEGRWSIMNISELRTP